MVDLPKDRPAFRGLAGVAGALAALLPSALGAALLPAHMAWYASLAMPPLPIPAAAPAWAFAAACALFGVTAGLLAQRYIKEKDVERRTAALTLARLFLLLLVPCAFAMRQIALCVLAAFMLPVSAAALCGRARPLCPAAPYLLAAEALPESALLVFAYALALLN